MKLGILGGNFDPIHICHLRSAEETGEKLGLKRVYLIPSSAPPHKTKEPHTPFYHRMAMARLAVENSKLLEALDLEGRRPGLSYSIETLKQFHNEFSTGSELFFIVGMDAFLEIDTWKEYRNLFDFAHFVIIQRVGFPPEMLAPYLLSLKLEFIKTKRPDTFITSSGNKLLIMNHPLLEVSSTRIRKMVKEGRSIYYLTPESVRNYIIEKGLYKEDAKPQ